ncbi:hypothetical protein CRG98_020140 [Punica granatum]|uniref:Protein kinase domain-containing protein n=1 Tax=Punica granatum TaxID=22663 RepID=A0A2I0JT62_PUNGR|nr:hypothetical protein CRG98_020140 [Punica granatum]
MRSFVAVSQNIALQMKQRKTAVSCPSNDGILKVSYEDLLIATDGFSSANLIGTSSFGSVFRGVRALLDQTPIAVKVIISIVTEHQRASLQSSDYQGNDFKALVYEFMVNGSLDEWLHPPVGTPGEQVGIPRQLGLVEGVNIAADVACALDYLHHQCGTSIVQFMPEATRELISDQTSSIAVNGTLGYIAPEYGAGAEVSTNGDLYSSAILILEMLTGKRPTNNMFSYGLNLHSYAKAAFPDRVLQIIDPVLLGESQDEDNGQDISLMETGVVSSSDVSRDRMSMTDVAAALQAIQNKLHGVRHPLSPYQSPPSCCLSHLHICNSLYHSDNTVNSSLLCLFDLQFPPTSTHILGVSSYDISVDLAHHLWFRAFTSSPTTTATVPGLLPVIFFFMVVDSHS